MGFGVWGLGFEVWGLGFGICVLSFSFCVMCIMQVAVNFEHSWGDGVCVLRMCNDVQAAVVKSAAAAAADGKHVQPQHASPLVFNTQAVAGDMAAAAKRFDAHAGGGGGGGGGDDDDDDDDDNNNNNNNNNNDNNDNDDDDVCRTASMKNIVVECKGLSRQQVKLLNAQNPKLQANAQNLKP